jgi:hypothetical protein
MSVRATSERALSTRPRTSPSRAARSQLHDARSRARAKRLVLIQKWPSLPCDQSSSPTRRLIGSAAARLQRRPGRARVCSPTGTPSRPPDEQICIMFVCNKSGPGSPRRPRLSVRRVACASPFARRLQAAIQSEPRDLTRARRRGRQRQFGTTSTRQPISGVAMKNTGLVPRAEAGAAPQRRPSRVVQPAGRPAR